MSTRYISPGGSPSKPEGTNGRSCFGIQGGRALSMMGCTLTSEVLSLLIVESGDLSRNSVSPYIHPTSPAVTSRHGTALPQSSIANPSSQEASRQELTRLDRCWRRTSHPRPNRSHATLWSPSQTLLQPTTTALSVPSPEYVCFDPPSSRLRHPADSCQDYRALVKIIEHSSRLSSTRQDYRALVKIIANPARRGARVFGSEANPAEKRRKLGQKRFVTDYDK